MPKPIRYMTPREEALYEALLAAEAHLSYCGYGDNWERECAEEQKLAEKINAALALCAP